MKYFAFVAGLAVALLAGDGLAQTDNRDSSGPGMSAEERQRMREQMPEGYRNRGERTNRPERPRQMSNERRESLRHDIEDANNDLKRKKSD